MRIGFDPILGIRLFEGSEDGAVEAAEKVQEEFDLYGPAAIGDVVVASTNQAEAVEALTANYYTGVAFGVITSFVTPTRVKVLAAGKLSGAVYQLAGLSFGQVLFVSATGKLTTTPPAGGHLQSMGFALKSDTIFLLPVYNKVVRA